MNFFCPRCRTTLAGVQEQGAHDSLHVACPGCGFVVDLAMADTRAGQPTLPIERDFCGETLDGLRLESCLGAGGMGTVYRAFDESSGERVAVKMMLPQFAAQPDLVERFRREAGALRELSHPGIVGYRGEGEADGRYYIVMELIDGDSLENVMNAGPVPVERACDIALGICAALEAAHQQGIVHRDLKPANIILSDGGVKVLDFGIAQVSMQDLTLTRSDAVLGTFNYMAPEQRIGARDIDHRADLFSLGVIIYRMLTKTLPIGVFEPPSRHNPQLGTHWDRVVSRLLNAAPERRYASASALRRDLEGLAAGGGRRRTLAVAAAAAVLLLAAAGLVAYGMRPNAEVADKNVEQSQPEDPREAPMGGLPAEESAEAALEALPEEQANTVRPKVPVSPVVQETKSLVSKEPADTGKIRKQQKLRKMRPAARVGASKKASGKLEFGSFSKGGRSPDKSKNVSDDARPQQRKAVESPPAKAPAVNKKRPYEQTVDPKAPLKSLD